MTLVFRIIDVMSSRGRTTLAVDCSEECSEAFEVELAATVTMRRATVRHDSFIGSSGPPTEEPTVERRSVRLSRAGRSSFARSTPPSEHREMRGICDLKQCGRCRAYRWDGCRMNPGQSASHANGRPHVVDREGEHPRSHTPILGCPVSN